MVADFYDKVPDDFPIPDGALSKSFYFESQHNKEIVRKIALALGDCEKDYTGSYFTLIKDFSGLVLAFTFARESVCEKRVVGFRECEGYTRPAYKEEIVEWECTSILSQKEADVLLKESSNALYKAAGPIETEEANSEHINRNKGGTDIPY